MRSTKRLLMSGYSGLYFSNAGPYPVLFTCSGVVLTCWTVVALAVGALLNLLSTPLAERSNWFTVTVSLVVGLSSNTLESTPHCLTVTCTVYRLHCFELGDAIGSTLGASDRVLVVMIA